MTKNQQRTPGHSGRARGAVWKSGLMASSLGALLLGWALLGQADASPESAAAQLASSQPRTVVVQMALPDDENGTRQQLTGLPAQTHERAGAASETSAQSAQVQNVLPEKNPQVVLPALPQRPIFRQPVTRTRGS
ncbi:MAG: hypothetical protein KF753_11225 [Caldilineaceae bacterium]|nr:hypothetical protein [Caldilineaceae bacterium]